MSTDIGQAPPPTGGIKAPPSDGGTKGFKGKGDARRRMREVEHQLNAVRRRMWELKHQTRAIRGRVFALEMDERPRREWVLLRWRYLLGGHAIWERDIEPQIAGFPEALQAWYRGVNTETLMLNVQERCLRYERRALRGLLRRLTG